MGFALPAGNPKTLTKMNFKPILYSTDMVQALQQGRKTMTRRTQGLEEINKQPDAYSVATVNIGEYVFEVRSQKSDVGSFDSMTDVTVRSKYQKGDILWVREKFSIHGHTTRHFIYRADVCGDHDLPDGCKWKPSIHMPKAAARIFLKVTNVRVERLQQISEEDAVAEGILYLESMQPYTMGYKLYGDHEISDILERKAVTGTSIESFETLWDMINGKGAFDFNPWVFVYEFEVLDRNADRSDRTDIAKANLLKSWEERNY